MVQISCAAIAAPEHGQWLSRWCADAGRFTSIKLQQLPAAYDFRLADAHAGKRFDAILMLVAEDALQWARDILVQISPQEAPVVAITRKLPADRLQELLRKGVRDFHPSDGDCNDLYLRVWRATAGEGRAERPSAVPQALHPRLRSFIGSSPAFLRQLERIPVMAGCDAGVLILGETGTGKELCAQAIHYLSPRAAYPWMAVNCGALPIELVESELFGHVRGAYTSAERSRTGLIGQADGGTLFLDEIDSLPHAAQAKLLRFLQEKEYRPVGGSRTEHANVRVLAASNSNLEQLIEQGAFRKDLYYRLNVLTMKMPPLRERLDDVVPLAEHFVSRFARQFQRAPSRLSASAKACITSYSWPGNVRELEHAIERAVLLSCSGVINAEDLDLPMTAAAPSAGESFKRAKEKVVRDFERVYLERMLLLHEGNITKAAQACAKNRRAFWQLLRKYNIDTRRYRTGIQS